MEKNKKRLILFMPSIEGGGVEKNLFIISNYLSSKIKNIILITFDTKFNNSFNKNIKILNVKKNQKKKYSKYYKYFRCLLLLYKEIKKKKSLVFAFQANVYCCVMSLLLGFKLITRSNSSPSGWSKNIFKNTIFKILFKVPEKIIVNSIDFKKEIDKKYQINSLHIYNPLNKDMIKKMSKNKINSNFFKNADLKIINVARFTDQKDHITLLKSICILIKKKINLKLLIMGYGPNFDKINYFIKNNNLGSHVKISNFDKNPFKFINASNLFILSSIYEGLPNVLLEAICLKKFVISSNCPTGPREILKNGKLGMLFLPKDEKGLANKILKYKSDKRKYNNLALRAYNSLDRFDYRSNCEKYYKIIDKHI